MSTNVAEWIEHWANHGPERIALHFEGDDISYGEFTDLVQNLARKLTHNLHVKPGDRVAYLGHNHPFYLVVYFACAKIGAIIVPLNFRLALYEHAEQLRLSQPRAVFATSDFAQHALEIDRLSGQLDGPEVIVIKTGDEILPEDRKFHLWADLLNVDDGRNKDIAQDPVQSSLSSELERPFLLMFTSGTTGRPKGVLLSQATVIWHALASGRAHDFRSDDHILTVLPMFHAGGLSIQTIPALQCGARITIHRRVSADAFLADVEEKKPTVTLVVPALMQACIASANWQSANLSSLRLVMAGSAPVTHNLIRAFHSKGIPVGQVYGCTEVTAMATYLGRHDAMSKVGSVGKPALHVSVKIVDDEGSKVVPGQTGEIFVSSRTLLSGYWGEEASDLLVDGTWFRTGDLGHYTDGFLFIDGRMKDMMISGGYNVFPAEIENVLLDCPGVAEVAVLGMPDPHWGETPVAAIVRERASDTVPTVDDVARFVLDRLARYKQPHLIVFVDTLPRNALGKVAKEDLRRQLPTQLKKRTSPIVVVSGEASGKGGI